MNEINASQRLRHACTVSLQSTLSSRAMPCHAVCIVTSLCLWRMSSSSASLTRTQRWKLCGCWVSCVARLWRSNRCIGM